MTYFLNELIQKYEILSSKTWQFLLSYQGLVCSSTFSISRRDSLMEALMSLVKEGVGVMVI